MISETIAKVVGLSPRKHQDWFGEADEEIQELLKKKCSCHNCLLAKPDDQAAKAAYKTACSMLQAELGLCRMICGQHLLRRHNAMLTLVACMPSMRHWRLSMDPHIRSKPFKLFTQKYPADRQRSYPPALVRTLNASSVTNALCRNHRPRFNKWM